MAENKERPFQPSDFGGATTKHRRFFNPINITTTTKSDWGCYISSNPAELPENVLEIVFSFLTSIEDRNAVSLVCKSWYRAEGLTRSNINIISSYAVSPHRVINRFGGATSVAIKGDQHWLSSLADCGASFGPWVNSMREAYRRLEKVYLKGMYVTDDDLGVLARSFPDLKELILVICEGFGAKGLRIVASECRQIRVFELIESDLNPDDEKDWLSWFPESSTSLESLLFDFVYFDMNFEALERLVTRSPSLKKLRLNWDVSFSQLHRLIVRAPQLTHLGTGRFGPPVEEHEYAAFATALAACKSLESLSGFIRVVPDYLRSIVPLCGNLKALDFFSTTINADELKSVICHCHNLQTLHLSYSVGDKGLKAVAATCKDLRVLRLHKENEGLVSKLGLLAVFKSCRKLQYIEYDCDGMTNAALTTMSKNCRDLRVLRISVTDRDIDEEALDEGIGAIVKNCKMITRLEVGGLLTDRGLWYIGRYGKLLRSLSFDFMEDSDMGLKYVLEGCSRLKKLKITDCPFGDSGLRGGSHRYYNMRFLLCMKSGRISRAGCAQIARQLLGKFGVEAHVLAYMSGNRRCYGGIKIYLNRR